MGANPDPRHVSHGRTIPSVTYSDQPYVVTTADGAWLCVITTGAGREGNGGQHIVTQRSVDRGATWGDRVAVEPPDGPEASWAVLAIAPGGRLFCFYTYNIDNLRKVKAVDPGFVQGQSGGATYRDGYCTRVDSLGAYVYKYSDDHGRSWSARRCLIPVREFDIDRENATGGAVRFFWNVGRPLVSGTEIFLPIHKVGNFGYGFFTRSEGALLFSRDLLTRADPARADWETLPEGRAGLRAPAGPIAEEHSFSELSDGSLHCVYRTVCGYPAVSWSRDRGRTWTPPDLMRRPDGRPLKNPRAANFAWRCGSGRFLYWFHNNGGPIVAERHSVDAGFPYQAPRNPIWMCGGVEHDTPMGKKISWSEPEIALYDDDPFLRMSYPDLIEEDGRTFVTETNKSLARVHELDPRQLEALWVQAAGGVVPSPAPVLELAAPPRKTLALPADAPMPRLPAFVVRDNERFDYGGKDLRTGLTIEIELRLHDFGCGQVLFDTRDRFGRGLLVCTNAAETLEIVAFDGQTRACWDTDAGAVKPGETHHVIAIVDGGPRIISFVVDGRLLDGGEERLCGWGRFSPHFADPNGGERARVGTALRGRIGLLRVYDRTLTVSQAVGRCRERRSSGHGGP
jgi:hypothetical protein